MQQHDTSIESSVKTLNSLLTATKDVLANCDMILAVINNQLLQLNAETANDDGDETNADSQQLSLLVSLLRKAEMEGKLPARARRSVSPVRMTSLVAKQRCNTPKKRSRLGVASRP